MNYEGNIYRPPTEADSLIIQLTIGCSHNGCIFCGMFKDKEFRLRPIDEVMEELNEARLTHQYIRSIFLADGDALSYRTKDLIKIFEYIKINIPECKHVASYATPRSLLLKKQEELDILHQKGLAVLYLGVESGSDNVLKYMNKGATADEIIIAGQKAKTAGFQLVAMMVAGLGGKNLWKEHATHSGRVLSLIKPDFIAAMTLNIVPGTKLYDKVQCGEFKMLTPYEILYETKMLINNIDIEGCVFLTNHISNYVYIYGTFNKEKSKMYMQIDDAIKFANINEQKYINL